MPDHVDPEACSDCSCPLEDHHFKDYEAYAASLRNDEPDFYLDRDPNVCADCCACPRDPMEAA